MWINLFMWVTAIIAIASLVAAVTPTPQGDKLLAKEAERVTKLISWNPGEVDGKIASVEMVLPFTFKLP